MGTITTPHATGGMRLVSGWWRSRLGGRLLIEISLIAALYLGYRQVRFLVRDQAAEAFANARSVVRIEEVFGLFVEPSVQRLTMRSDEFLKFLNLYYAHMHFYVTAALLVFLYSRYYDVYRRWRNIIVISTASALVIHALYPLAPPRKLPSLGFIDTLDRFGPALYDQHSLGGHANQFAAMPSLHFGYALVVALVAFELYRSRWRWLVVLHPTIMLLAIVATANHYWLDAGIAMVLVLVARWIVDRRSLRSDREPDRPDIESVPGNLAPH